eukprot:1157991-Pelagomonas_calceolata.AAC.8
MEIFCAVGAVEQAKQPKYLAEGQTPLSPLLAVVSTGGLCAWDATLLQPTCMRYNAETQALLTPVTQK